MIEIMAYNYIGIMGFGMLGIGRILDYPGLPFCF